MMAPQAHAASGSGPQPTFSGARTNVGK